MEQVPTILYWALALLVVLPFVSFQLSLAAYFLLVHLKLTGIGYESARSTQSGECDCDRDLTYDPTVADPFCRVSIDEQTWVFRLWILFVLYCAAASFWSPFRLSAFKQVGYS